ncbi:hypothetical protein VTO73DRAFT_7609 [Trametes versicolor]
MAPAADLHDLSVDAILGLPGLPSLNSTLGAILLGSIFGFMLYALMLHQTYRYFRMYPGDRLPLKLLILTIVLMETFHTVLWIIICYQYLVVNYFNPLNLIETHWYIKLTIPMTAITGMFSQIFYAGRVYYSTSFVSATEFQRLSSGNLVASSSKPGHSDLPFLLRLEYQVFVMFLSLGWDFAATVKVADTISSLIVQWIVSVAYGLAVVCDLITALALIFVLRRSRTGVKRTDTVVDALIMYTVNTGLLTTILGTLVFAFAIVYPDNLIYAGLSIPGVKLYSNSVLAMLNSRRSLSERMMQGFEAGTHDEGRAGRPQTPHTVLETWNIRQMPVTLPVTMDSTRSLGTHSDSAEPPSSGRTVDVEKASLADVQAERAEIAHVEVPVDHVVPHGTAEKVGGVALSVTLPSLPPTYSRTTFIASSATFSAAYLRSLLPSDRLMSSVPAKGPTAPRSRLCISRGEFVNLPVVAGVIPSSDFVARFERCVSLEDAAALCASSRTPVQAKPSACSSMRMSVRAHVSV